MGENVPHSIEAEQAVLGALLVDQNLASPVMSVVQPNYFFEPLHGKIYERILALIESGNTVNLITLAPFFADEDGVGELTVKQYFGRLVAGVPSLLPRSVASYASVIRELALRRELLVLGEGIQQEAKNGSAGVAEVASSAVGNLDTIISATRSSHTATQASLNASVCTLLEDIENGEQDKPITTGLRDVDRVIGGWRRGEYAILAARPSMGKSALAAEAMLNAAHAGHGVMMFSLEMTKKALAARCLSSAVWTPSAQIPYSDILNERITESQKDRLYEATPQFSRLPVEIEDQGGLTVSEIAAKARRQAARFEQEGRKLDLVIIDHLGKLRASKRYAGDKTNETGEVSNALAALGKELNVAMLVLHQLNRAVEGRTDKHPELADLRSTGDIEQDADTVGFLYRPAYYLERAKLDDEDADFERLNTLSRRKHELEIIIAKNRSGPCTTCECFVDIASNVIRNLQKEGGR